MGIRDALSPDRVRFLEAGFEAEVIHHVAESPLRHLAESRALRGAWQTAVSAVFDRSRKQGIIRPFKATYANASSPKHSGLDGLPFGCRVGNGWVLCVGGSS